MITPMTKYSFILLNGKQNDLVETLQDIGLVDISRSTKPVDEKSHEIMANIDLVNGLIQGLKKADIPEGTQPEAIDGDIVRLAGGMLMRYTEDREEIKRLQSDIEAVRTWGDYDIDILKELADAGAEIHFHVLSNKAFKPEWKEEYPLAVIKRQKNRIWFLVAGEDHLPGEVHAPDTNVEELKKQLKDKKKHYKVVLSRLLGAQQRIEELEQIKEQHLSELDLYLASATAVPAAEDTIVTLVGYAPTSKEEVVTKALDATDILYLKEEAVVEDNPPISFNNNWFVRQFEALTDMYGRPAYNGFDPTPFISVFFLLFFALCMGDAGYGLILIVVGLLLKKVPSFKDMAPLVTLLGIGTVIVGFFLHTFFSIDISTWKIFEPVKFLFLPDEIAGYAGGMVLAIVVGIIHIWWWVSFTSAWPWWSKPSRP